MPSLLLDIFKPALRRAGITTLPGIIPSTDQTGELIPELNRMMSLASLDGHKIYTTAIDRYQMTPLQTTYFLGPTGDWVAPRPNWIVRANVVLLDSSPELHLPLYLLDDKEWAAHVITELQMPWPYQLYNDGSYPDSQIYLFGFPSQTNDIELFTPQELKQDFTDLTDTVSFPPGYEAWIVPALALKAASLYPYDSKLSGLQLQALRDEARQAMDWIQINNSECVDMTNEAASLGSYGDGPGNLRAAFE